MRGIMSCTVNDFLHPANWLPEIPSGVKKTAVIGSGLVVGFCLGYGIYKYAQARLENAAREKIADYIVIGCTRDHKLTQDELAIKGEAIAIRRKITLLFEQAIRQEIPGVNEEDLGKVKKIFKAGQAFFAFWDNTISNTEAPVNLPNWWLAMEPKIQSEMEKRIQLVYSTNPEVKQKKEEERKKSLLLMDRICNKIRERNQPLTLVQSSAINVLQIALKSLI